MNDLYVETPLVIKARLAATEAHATSKPYGGLPYIVHPAFVASFGYRSFGLLAILNDAEARIEATACALWLHDVMEDCAWTYNDFLRDFNEPVAEIVYYVSDHKGKNRYERQQRTYEEMAGRLEPTFVKLCDRYVNVWWSITTGGKLAKTYAEEWDKFQRLLRVGEPATVLLPLWEANETLIKSI